MVKEENMVEFYGLSIFFFDRFDGLSVLVASI